MSTVVDYRGYVTDVFAFEGVKRDGMQRLTYAMFSSSSAGLLCAGVQKLAQWFLLELFTPAGSMQGLPNYGTDFLKEVRSGQLQSELDVFTSFYLAAGTVKSHLQAEELETDPLDERIGSIELTGVTFEDGKITLRTTIGSAAGTVHPILVPIGVTP